MPAGSADYVKRIDELTFTLTLRDITIHQTADNVAYTIGAASSDPRILPDRLREVVDLVGLITVLASERR